MYSTTFRKVGGSLMLSVPPALIEALNIKPGDAGTIEVRDGQLVAAPLKRPSRGRRTVAQIVAGIDPQDVAEWRATAVTDLMSDPVGKEII
ncbi:AbrB/MazE/SpoVT family DNA-binding domain-containing protein [Salmonella enterica]|uniref:AbrB/MazE/SpoVT family DNA-binding domain-containing protein n=1 Tax=Salmonella enterica TaxID=28901 RepID=UPI0009AFF18C|nr:AbrB/MazE/SpoVT family DNA-binding domain-containing protein [Salmonella enterica]EBW2268522.1 AbrB/MazE/SpoVT family DNA-binding domain-containing protein [Salmonella enterica subsp. enterica serovar Hillingdon]ECB6312615.1 AbrB/MazE/SpoVT family DNA-binding domain-containing protein [Salmonella enterica subsp. enterica serovar Chailey]EDR3562110.1 AbrB/MazE/SpoVT family DNA-binding domain-containing protein [Salmonella enterica subsp. enterica serovar Benue]MIW33705.1 AbrB/MazE/SpoVT famil